MCDYAFDETKNLKLTEAKQICTLGFHSPSPWIRFFKKYIYLWELYSVNTDKFYIREDAEFQK